jgi:glycosyltransferase 2 family protein
VGIRREQPAYRARRAVRGKLSRGARRILGFTRSVAWRERVLHLGATAIAVANARRVRIAAQLLLLAGLVFVLLRLRSIWRDSHIDLHHVGWAAVTGAVLLAACAMAASAFIWMAILRQLGAPTRARWVGVFFQAQLGKYIPGSVWQYAGRTALARAHQIPVRPVAISLAVEFAGSMAGAAVLSLLVFGWWGAIAVPVVLVAVALALRLRSDASGRGAGRVALRTTSLYIAAWPLTGISFWLVGRALFDAPLRDMAVYVGAFAAAWAVGVIAVYAPGGLGVREAVLVAILRGKIGSADALVLAAASRVVLAFVDVVLAGSGALLLRRSVGRPPSNAALIPPSP